MQIETSLKLLAGCLLALSGLANASEEPQLIFKAPSQADQKYKNQEIEHPPEEAHWQKSRNEVLKDALGYEFDDEAFVKNYVCDPNKAYTIQITNREPFLMIIDDLFTSEECDHLIAAGLPMLRRSLIVAMGGEEEGRAVSEWRTSYTAFMPRSYDKVFDCLEDRLAKIVSLPKQNIEPLQLVRYFPGQQYREHFDWFHHDEAGEIELARGGQRFISMFAYLNTLNPDQGGQTRFPHLNLSVSAKKGRATFWFNVDVDGVEHEHVLHAGLPVSYGTKFGLNVPIRERRFQ